MEAAQGRSKSGRITSDKNQLKREEPSANSFRRSRSPKVLHLSVNAVRMGRPEVVKPLLLMGVSMPLGRIIIAAPPRPWRVTSTPTTQRVKRRY
ncbi:hypothetical protein AJ80_09430 [Polytolypa hystricis UAMH7299]|uniref:Uncharacterized protein n=1 Tax=Polytolypa hystricis (strain UAMH7299) TaxID=1447883 RepID=A0A2B7WQE3_POLH7|nr:hypothetical protein AJ80_09430 [Polytolypa hystricis UAMH7299]